MNLGNILYASGFEVIYVDRYIFRWLPKYKFFYKFFGEKIFNFLCFFYGFFNKKLSEFIGVAKKK